jgi:hypothetical protein
MTTLANSSLALSRETLYRITRKQALWQGSISSFLFCPQHTLPPSQGSRAPKLDVRSLWMFGTSSTTASAAHDDNHRRPWTKPRPYLDESSSHYGHKGPELHRGAFWNRPPLNTRVTTLPPFVTYSGHPSKWWSLSPMLNLSDQEIRSTTSPERKVARQYKFPLILSATLDQSMVCITKSHTSWNSVQQGLRGTFLSTFLPQASFYAWQCDTMDNTNFFIVMRSRHMLHNTVLISSSAIYFIIFYCLLNTVTSTP